MKIAYISPTFLSDVDLSLLPELRKLADIDYYIQLSPIYLHGAAVNISTQHPEPGVFSADIYTELRKFDALFPLDHTYVVNDTGRHTYSPSSFVCYFKLYVWLRRQQYDVIHFTHPFLMPGFILYRFSRRMLMTVHDPLPHSSERNFLTAWIRRKAFSSVRRFVLLNKAQRQEFINCYHLEDAHIYDGTLSSYTYLQAYVPDETKQETASPYILMFGQISSHKGADYLLRAMEEIHRHKPDVRLVVAGRWKWQFAELGRYAQLDYIDIENRFIPDDELARLIAGSRLVVVPYLDATQSGVVMSAFAFSKPCIATSVGGLPEMVVDGRYGLIVHSADSHAIAEAALQLLSSPERLAQMSANIRSDYHEGEKSWKRIAADLFNIYKEIR